MLIIPGPLHTATFIGKLNRFVAFVDLNGATVHAHIPTSSRMGELLMPGAEVLLAGRAREGRMTPYSLIMVPNGGVLVSVDSGVPNRLLDVELRAGALAEFAGWEYARREVVLGESRLDFLLVQGDRRCWVEAKSVTLVRDDLALFPDAPTIRGTRHMGELAAAREAGDRAAAVFIIQRNDAARFSPNHALDPDFAHALEDAMRRGVEVYAFACEVTPERIAIVGRVEVVM